MSDFLKPKSSYENLIAYKKSECIYDLTVYFIEHYLGKGDRTIDQMKQAARSGKQNIAEGRSNGNTSAEMEIKLMNVAKSSLQELLLDYKDYLRVKDKELWTSAHPRFAKMVEMCKANNESAFYRNLAPKMNDVELSNVAITLIHQTDRMLGSLIELLKKDFLEKGGIKEAMYRARIEARGQRSYNK
ncbi:MAG: four helix bundle suffix domain-containing protein [Muribaculaceae bacterium]|nr:four helix bundle protein [Bacteroides sp.]MDE6071294.1 four helix bundle suffix domain-containing protein [Muribaculaceae bacterium]